MLAGSYYFLCPGIVYGLFTSRLPAVSENTGAEPKDLGLMLFAAGCASMVSLVFTPAIIKKFTSRRLLPFYLLMLLVSILVLASCTTVWQLILAAMMFGIFFGGMDTSMNTQGIVIENKFKKRCISGMHAFYGIGGILGALVASAFAYFHIGPFINYAVIAVIVLAGIFPTALKLVPDTEIFFGNPEEKIKRGGIFSLPCVVFLCGILCMCGFMVEGSVGEWGSVLLYSEKGASQSTAALVFATYYVTAVTARLFTDRVVRRVNDYSVLLFGGLLCVFCMSMIILLDNPVLCLVFYAIMGFGLGPVVPLMFSRAGSVPGVSPADASALVSFLGYSGLLFFPPLLGYVAQITGLAKALTLAIVLCALIVLLSFALRRYKTQ